MSPGAVRRLGVTAKARLTQAREILGGIASWLAGRGVETVFDEQTGRLAGPVSGVAVVTGEALPGACDMILVLGGDGTLLDVADRIAAAGVDVPMLGVNFGGLGFLTEITLPELYSALESALAGTAEFDERMMLSSEVVRDGKTAHRHVALNDVVITNGALSRIIELSVSVGGQFVSRFKADGLIIATPTGSTAYNLAAGGPIVHPVVDALVLTPIAPHTLTNRPIVIPGRSDVGVEPVFEGSRDAVFVSFDGQSGSQLEPSDSVRVRRAGRSIRLVRATSRSYFEVLRQKLKWGER